MKDLDMKLFDLAFRALEDRPPRNLRHYARVPEADECEECGDTGEVERKRDGAIVECAFCRPAPRFRTADEAAAYEAGVPSRGEI